MKKYFNPLKPDSARIVYEILPLQYADPDVAPSPLNMQVEIRDKDSVLVCVPRDLTYQEQKSMVLFWNGRDNEGDTVSFENGPFTVKLNLRYREGRQASQKHMVPSRLRASVRPAPRHRGDLLSPCFLRKHGRNPVSLYYDYKIQKRETGDLSKISNAVRYGLQTASQPLNAIGISRLAHRSASQRPDLNRRPAVYETAALPTELRWHSKRAIVIRHRGPFRLTIDLYVFKSLTF